MSSQSGDEKTAIKGMINRVDNWTGYSAENGLFDNNNEAFDKIQASLRQARIHVQSSESDAVPKSNEYLSYAIKYYSDALHSSNIKWRFLFQYAGDVWGYLLGILATIFFLYYSHTIDNIATTFALPRIAIDATIWGVVGSILRGLWYLWKRLNDRAYRRSWRIWFYSCPFIGGILGAIVYLLIITGLVVISQTQSIDPTTGGNLIVMGFCILAGYNWEWAIERLNKIGETI